MSPHGQQRQHTAAHLALVSPATSQDSISSIRLGTLGVIGDGLTTIGNESPVSREDAKGTVAENSE